MGSEHLPAFVAAFLASQLTACNPNSAGIRVDYVGSTLPAEIRVENGKCKRIESTTQNESFAAFECGVTGGNRKVFAKCASNNLPEAFVEGYFEPGSDSNYVLFNDPCSKTTTEIKDENARAKTPLTVWGKVSPRTN
jgi:hypothetical protein